MPKKIKESIVYELDNPFEYAYKGDMVEAQFITLKAPTSRNKLDCADLKQAFLRALPQNGGQEQVSKDNASIDDLDGEAIMTLISMSNHIKLRDVLLYAVELFSSGVALIDGETKLTKPLLELIDPDDLEEMLGRYYINFILASWLTKMKKTLSK